MIGYVERVVPEAGKATFALLKRTVAAFRAAGLSDWAAALTYYALLSVFPIVIALVSVVGIFGDPQSTTRAILEMVARVGPDSAVRTFSGPVRSLSSNHSGAGLALVLGLGAALWAASGYVGAFGRASAAIHGVEAQQPFLRQRAAQLLITFAMVLLIALVAVGLVMTGPLVRAVAEPIGVGDTALTVWSIAKWPVLALLFLLLLALLFRSSPGEHRGLITWGACTTLVVWLLASAAFALYVSNFGSYGKTYGALAGPIVLLVWLWLTNLAVLFGHQLDALRAGGGPA
ncbi:MAG TPA: YihY/virulence factor BrkB family protein [Solirubrobacterales bacterium]|nr:YihY/virulence factor BrkB family protein [Solirubrobacterales bacterium]